MLYRQRMHFFPKSQEAWMELLRLGDEFNKLLAQVLDTSTFWMPTAGETEVIAEFDYPDLAAFERESIHMFTEPDLMALGGTGTTIPSTHPSEPFGPVPSFSQRTFGGALSSGVA